MPKKYAYCSQMLMKDVMKSDGWSHRHYLNKYIIHLKYTKFKYVIIILNISCNVGYYTGTVYNAMVKLIAGLHFIFNSNGNFRHSWMH